LGAPYFDARPLSSFIKSQQIVVFLNLGQDKEGFVAPAGTGPQFGTLELANAHERIPKAVRELQETYQFEQFDDSPLHKSIRIYAEFVARAIRHDIDGRSNEALLHFVIALELVFGEAQSIQRSVAERVAVVACRGKSAFFDEQRTWVERLYELRSRYVHSGVDIKDQPLDRLRAVCEEMFRCLMRLQAAHPRRESRTENVLKNWLRQLDYMAKGMIVGKTPSEGELGSAFILSDSVRPS
jgi:hypothetical protein